MASPSSPGANFPPSLSSSSSAKSQPSTLLSPSPLTSPSLPPSVAPSSSRSPSASSSSPDPGANTAPHGATVRSQKDNLLRNRVKVQQPFPPAPATSSSSSHDDVPTTVNTNTKKKGGSSDGDAVSKATKSAPDAVSKGTKIKRSKSCQDIAGEVMGDGGAQSAARGDKETRDMYKEYLSSVQSFSNRRFLASYLQRELLGENVPDETGIWQLQKERALYNFLRVPIQLEKLLMFGYMICFDSFLFLFSFLPIRFAFSVFKMLLRPFGLTQLSRSNKYDFMYGLIFLLSFSVLWMVDTSIVYHYIRGQAVIKLYVIFNLLEIFDKLCCSFGQDIFDTLVISTQDITMRSTRSGSGGVASSQQMRGEDVVRLFTPLVHFIVAFAYVLIHSCVLFLQVTTLNVSMNSHSNSLFTLLISNNFVELKGHVFKRSETENLFQISCSDMVERFQISIFLLIIVMQNSADVDWQFGQPHIFSHLFAVAQVWILECVVDWIKHGFVSKFNRISPEVYNKFQRILRADLVGGSRHFNRGRWMENSQLVTRRIGFVPLPLGCLFAKALFHVAPFRGYGGLLLLGVMMACTIALKVLVHLNLLGFSLKKTRFDDTNMTMTTSQAHIKLAGVQRYSMAKGKIP
eukprot:TRINITY_DN346_c0_g1_i1.p2 TRINITY_DN346_c0_g1~~TRINITY_DN346_c0_g1_i1.p2  ORF type:complete len:631 (+),score=115.81 TRINITY_DN346_c0_g1_i1:507-2399(+)